jgi:hypothetical protein
VDQRRAEAFDEILSDRGDFCAFAVARGVAAILEKPVVNMLRAQPSRNPSSQQMTPRTLWPKPLCWAGGFIPMFG